MRRLLALDPGADRSRDAQGAAIAGGAGGEARAAEDARINGRMATSEWRIGKQEEARDARYSLFAIRYSLFAIRYSLFAIRYSLFAIRYSLFAIRYSLFANHACRSGTRTTRPS